MVMINKKTINKDVETLEDGKILFNFNFVCSTLIKTIKILKQGIIILKKKL